MEDDGEGEREGDEGNEGNIVHVLKRSSRPCRETTTNLINTRPRALQNWNLQETRTASYSYPKLGNINNREICLQAQAADATA